MPLTLRQTWPMQQGQAVERGLDQVAAERTSCSSIRPTAPAHGAGRLAHRRASGPGSPTGGCPPAPGCPPRACWPASSGCRAGSSWRPTSGWPTRACSAAGAAAGRRCWPRRPGPAPGRAEPAPDRGRRSTCAPACPTCPRSRARPGCAPNAPRWPARPDADARLRRPARHPRAAHRARDVAGPVPRGARRSRGRSSS